MTTKERKKKIERYLEGVFNLSPAAKEPHFSSADCECCGDSLGGGRYDFVGRLGKKHDAEIIELSCCADCFGYLFT